MNGELRLNMDSLSAIPNTVSEGDLFVAEDVSELYIDTANNGRIRISDIFVTNTMVSLNAITTPLNNKFYYVREKNTFYTYGGSTTVYTFASYSDEEMTTQEATGRAQHVSNTNANTTIEIIESSDENSIGNRYVIEATSFTPGTAYRLYDTSGNAEDIWVTISGSSTVKRWNPVGNGVFTDLLTDVEADRLKSAISITLTGKATGTVSTDLGGNVTINTSLSNSGVNADTYGESTDKSLSASGSFVIPKITVAADGTVTDITPITISIPSSLGITNAILAGADDAITSSATDLTNGYVFVNLLQDSNIVKSFNVVGRGATSVITDNGAIIVQSSNDNTTYNATGGITRVAADANADDDYIFQHTNTITAGSSDNSSTGTVNFGGSFKVPTFTYDANGHITGVDKITVTLPSTPTDKDVASAPGATTKAYVTGTASATAGNGSLIFDTGVYLDTEAGALVATKFKGALDGTADKATNDVDGNAIKTTYAKLASPALTGTPTAPTANVGTNTTQIATTEFVASAIAAIGDVLVFKGTLGNGGTVESLPTSPKRGDEYKIITPGTYDGQVAEAGDLIICIDGTANNAHWTVVQGNIDGAVTSGDSTTTDQITVTKPNASTIRVNHANSGATAGSYGPSADSNLVHEGTFSIPYVTVNATGHVTSIANKTMTLPAHTDQNVKNTLATTTKAYVTGTSTATTNTGEQVFDTGVYLDTEAGTLVATKFKGALDGNAGTATKLAAAKNIEGMAFDGSAKVTYFGTCNTAAATAAKTVTVGSSNTFTLETGARAIVKFKYANTAANMKLAVNSTTSKAVYCNGVAVGNDSTIIAGGVYEFVYDGTYWQLIGTMRSITSDSASDSDYVAASSKLVHGHTNAAAVTIQTSNWSASTTTVNGTAYYTYEYTATKVWEANPICFLTSASGADLPSQDEATQYNNIAYVTGNTSTNKVKFYATNKPSCTLKIVVRSVV